MKNRSSLNKRMVFAIVLVSVVSLPSCRVSDWLTGKGKSACGCGCGDNKGVHDQNNPQLGGELLASWKDGSAVVTKQEFEDRLNMLLREKPELQSVSEAFMPILKGQLLTSLVYEKIIGKWVRENKVDQRAEYQERQDHIVKAVQNAVNAEFFSKEFEVVPTASEKQAFYDENKDRINGILISRGGTKAVGVQFENEKAAQDFLAKVKSKSEEFEKIVEADATLKDKKQDFNFLNNQSRGVNRVLLRKVLEIEKVPAVQLVKVKDDSVWVVNATEKKESTYRPYEEVSDEIEKMVKQSKQGEILQKELESLKVAYGVNIRENAFSIPRPQQQVAQAESQIEETLETAEIEKEAKPVAKAV